MMKWADLIDQNAEEIATLDAIDAGTLYHFAKDIAIPSGANTLRYYASS